MNGYKFVLNLLYFLFILISKVQSRQPNFVFILTDDQDTEIGSVSEMPKLLSLVAERGATFVNSFVSSPLCCPSRSSIFTGQYVHNHKAFNNFIDGGCNSLEWQNGPEKNSFPALLNSAGYATFFAGKYLNEYGDPSVGGTEHVPPGWDSWIGLKGNSMYYNYFLSINGTSVFHGHDPQLDYLTSVIKNEGLNFIENISPSTPFFMMLSTPASHAPYTPEPKYENSLNSSTIPNTPNFNIVNENKNWFVQLGEQPLKQRLLDKLGNIYRNRLRTLLSVDDMVSEIMQSLSAKRLLEDTYIFYSSDNGYHLGQFSMPTDKRQPYEFDIKVPLIIRGPGITKGIQIEDMVVNIDLAPTFLDLAGIPIPQNMDGNSLKSILINNTQGSSITERSILIEHLGEGSDDVPVFCEGLGPDLKNCFPRYDCKCQDSKNNTYSCVRTLGVNKNEKYCLWKEFDNFEEYYNISIDPYEITNSIDSLSAKQYYEVTRKLNFLLICTGSSCSYIK